MKIPYIAETSRVNGSRQGGILAYWEPEGGSPTATKTTLGKLSLELKKLTGLCYLTEELLADAPALSSWVTKAFKQEFDFRIVDAIVNGDGAGKPLGIMNAPCLVTVTAVAGQGAGTLISDNVIGIYARRFGPNTGNYVWLINQDIEPQLHTMTISAGTGGVPVYMPASGWNGQLYGTLFNRPVIPCESCQTLGTAGDIILADLSQYVMIDKGSMQSASSIHVKFVEGETAFRFVYRVDGLPWWKSALTPFKGNNTQSPFVCLSSTRT
jgi:HK97 family phage major capsid protein